MDYQSSELLRWEGEGGLIVIDKIAAIEAIICQRMKDYSNARNCHDVRAMAMFFAQDADLIGTTGRVVKGRPAIEANFRREYASVYSTSSAIRQINEIRLINHDVVVANGQFEVSSALSSEGKPLEPFTGLFTLIWKRVGSEWLITAYRSMMPTDVFREAHQYRAAGTHTN